MIRGGSILPAQKPADTTTASRKNNFELLITLDNVKKAKGELYWDDGDSLGMYQNNITINCFITNNCNNFFFNVYKNSFNKFKFNSDSFEKRQFVWTFFNIENNTLSNSKATKSYFNEKIILDKIQIWGITSNISKVFLNDREIRFEYIKKENVSFNA